MSISKILALNVCLVASITLLAGCSYFGVGVENDVQNTADANFKKIDLMAEQNTYVTPVPSSVFQQVKSSHTMPEQNAENMGTSYADITNRTSHGSVQIYSLD